MAEGFLQLSTAGSKSMEILGHEYFEELLSRSFFQHESDEDSLYGMHDLMNDLATFVAGDFFFRLDNMTADGQPIVGMVIECFLVFGRFVYGIVLIWLKCQALPSLRVLDIDGCCDGVLRSLVHVAPSVTRLKMSQVSGLTQLHRGVIEYLGAVEDLRIKGCDEVRHLWESEAEACKILPNLRKLIVWNCENLVCLGEKEELNCASSLSSLRELEILNCPKLERQKFPSTLKMLAIWNCDKLLVEESGVVGENSSANLNSSMSSLESLYIDRWPNLKWLPDMRFFIHLTSLWIDNCEGIESFPVPVPERGYGVLPLGLRSLYIRDCKNLKSFPHDELPTLTSLTHLKIYDCPNMDDSFLVGFGLPI